MVMATMTAMHEHVHEREHKNQQVWLRAEHPGAKLGGEDEECTNTLPRLRHPSLVLCYPDMGSREAPRRRRCVAGSDVAGDLHNDLCVVSRHGQRAFAMTY